jgi:phosphoglycolate phosphatase-like HAD superfamily hydrolase
MAIIQIEELKQRNIEVANDGIRGQRFACAIFDFDGTVSLLREQWRRVMSQVMVEMISGKSQSTPEIQQEVKEYIEESTGIQTIYQMRHLVELVRRYALVPSEEILTAEEYKRIYDERLLKVVDEQLAKIESGEAPSDVFLIPGVVDFLDLLNNLGLVLYVTSGTDRKYVQHEAMVLGVSHFFQEIYGPDPALPDYSKDWVVYQVAQQNNLRPDQLLVVGDGPVEIAAAKRHCSFAVGVASTEKPDGGLNHTKRRVLLRAGADIIIPNFADSRLLISYLFDEDFRAA